MNFFEKVKGFLLEPSKTFDAIKGEKLSEAIKYYVIIAAVYSSFLALLVAFLPTYDGSIMGGRNPGMLIGADARAGDAIIIFVLLMISLIVGIFVGGAILHIFVYIVGGRKGIAQTIKVIMYASTPGLLFHWNLGFLLTYCIPFQIIIMFILIWSIRLNILGIRQLHELTTGKAVLAVPIPLILTVILTVFTVIMIAYIGNIFVSLMFGDMGT